MRTILQNLFEKSHKMTYFPQLLDKKIPKSEEMKIGQSTSVQSEVHMTNRSSETSALLP